MLSSAAAGVAGAGWATRAAAAQTRPAGASVTAFVTDATGRRHASCDAVLHPGASGAAETVLTIDAGQSKQPIFGFGAALTEAACSALSRVPNAERATLFDELFSPGKSNFTTCRLCIGASDYATGLYSYDEGAPDPTLSRFSIDHDRVAVLPILRQARGVRPDLFLFASPWSPPGWMKYGDSMLGGSIRPRNTKVYAQYILRYLQAYAAAGVPVDAMTIQNETDSDQDGTMPACTWSEEVESSYIGEHLGPLLEQSGMHTQLWILDHNYNLTGRLFDQLAKPEVRKYISAIAWHGYFGKVTQINDVQLRYPDLPMYWTEGGDGVGTPDLLTDWARWAGVFAGVLNNGCRSITTWNLALDEAGRPTIGPFGCAGMLTVDSKTNAVTRNGIYWALVHFARAMPKDSKVLACKGEGLDVQAVAARRPDGTLAVVVSNTGPESRVRLDVLREDAMTGSPVRFTAAGNSVTTLLITS